MPAYTYFIFGWYLQTPVIRSSGKIKINVIMEIEEKDVKVKISYCPECGGACRIAIEHAMTKESKKDFMKEVLKYNLDVKTISLDEYRKGNESLGCKEECSLKTES